MEKDFIQSLQFAGFTARIKRLSDQLLYSARDVYAHLDTDIEPNWHLVFLLLKQEEALTVTEIAQHLRFSHPAVIKIVKKMKERDYLSSRTDEQDSRRQLIALTSKSLEILPILETKWDEIQQTIQGFVTPEFLQELVNIENQLTERNLYERYIDYTSNNSINEG
jgi:DNA-binding MarR family transcriptional regulator